MSTFDSATFHLIQRMKTTHHWERIQWKLVVQEYLKKHNMPPTLNTKGFQKRMSSWYHETRRPNKSDNPKVTGTKSTEEQIEERRAAAEAHGTLIDLSTEEKPTTKEELRTWLQEYCQGVKKHGEPNTWDVTSVTDMSELFAGLDTFNAPIDQWDTSQVTNMNVPCFDGATTFNQPLTIEHVAGDEHGFHVLWCHSVQSATGVVRHRAGDGYGFHVS